MIEQLSQEQYRSAVGISKSDLDQIAPPKTPAHYWAHITGARSKEQTAAMRFGSVLHTAVLEPDRLNVICKPEGFDGRSKDGKAWLLENAGKDIVSVEELSAVMQIVTNVKIHPVASRLIRSGKAEQSLFWKNHNGQTLKCRPDFMPDSGNVLVDVKTTACADYDAFSKSIYAYRYHVQAAYYLDICAALGLPYTTFVFIAVEKTAPYQVVTYQLDDDALEMGRAEYKRDLATILHCNQTGVWPGYPEELLPITLPEWAMPQG